MKKILIAIGFVMMLSAGTAQAVPADCDLSTGKCRPLTDEEQAKTSAPIAPREEEKSHIGTFVGVIIGLAVGAGILKMSVFTVSQQTAEVIERFGKYTRVANAGLQFKIPFIDRRAGAVDLRIQQLNVNAETKTKDNVFVNVAVSVQFFVAAEKVYEAFYKLQDEDKQIAAYVFDVIRSKLPSLSLDDAFEKKLEVANAVKESLTQTMDDFGYSIVTTLVTDIEPAMIVKESMNAINAAQRNREAATEKGEADKILTVKKAEAEAESKKLQGQGIADQRKAIINGLQESVEKFEKSIPGTSPQDVMNLVLITQYFDTLKDLGTHSRTNTIMLPHSPGALGDIADQLRNTIISANKASTTPPADTESNTFGVGARIK